MNQLVKIISNEEQRKWLQNLSYSHLGNQVIPDETNPKYLLNFAKFQELPYSEQMLDLFAQYIKNFVIYPFLTMPYYWSCSCLIRDGIERYPYLRINMANQEVFTIKAQNKVLIKWTINETVEKSMQLNVDSLKALLKFSRVERWGDGNIKRISFYSDSLEQAQNVMDNPKFCLIIRHCNYYLMQRQTLHHSRYNYRLAQEIQQYLYGITVEDNLLQQDEFITYPLEVIEGEITETTIRRRKRSQQLVRTLKNKVSPLICCICEFDFARKYGEVGRGFIEAHHKKPLATADENDITRESDIALVCANCHRMLHRKVPPYTIEELKEMIKKHNDH